MAVTLSSLVPDAEDVLKRSPEELACPLLKVIDSLPQQQRHRYNYLLSPDATAGYPQKYHDEIKQAQNEAWEWLRSQGHIGPKADSNDRDFVDLTRKGREYLKNCSTELSTPDVRIRRTPGTTEQDLKEPPQPDSSVTSELVQLPPWAGAAFASRCAMRAVPLFVPDKSRPVEDAKADLRAIEICWMVTALAAAQGRSRDHNVVGAARSAALLARDAVARSDGWEFAAAHVAVAAAAVAWNIDSVRPQVVEEAETSHELAFARYGNSNHALATITSKATACLSRDFIALRDLAVPPGEESTAVRNFLERPLWFGEFSPVALLNPLLGPWRIRLLELSLDDIYQRHVRILQGGGVDWNDAERRVQDWASQHPPAEVPREGTEFVRVAADIRHPQVSAGRPGLRMLADIPLEEDAADRLGFQAYAHALAGLIDSPDTATPLTLAINAPWGAGKTTLALMIKRLLKRKPSAAGKRPHVTCWFNAWMHDDAPNLACAFAAEVAQTANSARSPWKRFINPIPAGLLPVSRRQRLVPFLVTLDVLFFMFCVAELRFPAVVSHFLLGVAAVVGLTAITNLGALLQPLRALAPFAQAVARFVSDPESTATTASMNEVSEQLRQLIEQATPSYSKFVIFVDDLERCRPPRAVDVLEVVNQLLNHERVVTIVTGDMPAVAACAEIKYRDLAQRYTPSGSLSDGGASRSYGREYLQKIIQLQFDLPMYSPATIHSLMKELIEDTPSEPEGEQRGPARLFPRISMLARRLWTRTPGFAAARRTIDKEIETRVAAGEQDLIAIEGAVANKLKGSLSPALLHDLIRERMQRRLSDESEPMNEAQAEAMNYVEPFPRHAKRLLNRLRLLLFVAHERKMFGGTPELTPRHIGKWAVLCERWPELAQALTSRPWLMSELEGRGGTENDKYYKVLTKLVPAYTDDSLLPGFCGSGIKLAPLMERIVRFEPAPLTPRAGPL